MNLRFESTRAPPPDALRRGLERNLSRTLVLGFFQVFLVFMPVAVPFFQSRGLSMQEVFSLQALFGLVVLVTEVPSGYLADLLGRAGRRTTSHCARRGRGARGRGPRRGGRAAPHRRRSARPARRERRRHRRFRSCRRGDLTCRRPSSTATRA